MKKALISTLIIVLSLSNVFTQITKENTFSFGADCFPIHLQNNGTKYCTIDVNRSHKKSTIHFYNADHTLFRSITIQLNRFLDTSRYEKWGIWYKNISDNLFNTDDKIEVLFAIEAYGHNAEPYDAVFVLNEEGIRLFEKHNATFDMLNFYYGKQMQNIYQFNGDAKMILGCHKNDSFKHIIYDLPGSFNSNLFNVPPGITYKK